MAQFLLVLVEVYLISLYDHVRSFLDGCEHVQI